MASSPTDHPGSEEPEWRAGPGDVDVPAADPVRPTMLARLLAPVHHGYLELSLIDVLAVGLIIGFLVYLNQLSSPNHIPILVASLASSAVVLFSLPGQDIARSWNVCAGQFIGALAGFICVAAPGDRVAVMAGTAVALAFVLMRLANALHPPGAATALLVAVVPSDQGIRFLFFPVLAGAVLITAFAWAVHLLERYLRVRMQRTIGPAED